MSGNCQSATSPSPIPSPAFGRRTPVWEAVWRFGALAVWPCVLAGCQGGAVPISGKVITGEISFMGAVAPGDERLKGPGIEGVTVSGRTVVDNQTGFDLGEVTSDAKGDFKLKVKEQKAFSRPAEFEATKPGYLAARGRMPLPPTDRRLLIVLRPEAGAATTAPAGR